MTASLDEIVANKRRELAARRPALNSGVPPATTNGGAPGGGLARMLNALTAEAAVRLIAEIKPRSPAAGELNTNVYLPAIAQLYSTHACAISVLTDEKYFGGSLEALQQVAAMTRVPVLCKEFIVDPIQVHDAYAAGAAGVLLIVKILTDAELALVRFTARSLDLASVIEVQNEDELECALNVQPDVVLINNRNLSTYEIDLGTTERLAPQVPAGIPVVSASGVETRADIDRLLPFTNKFLVGSSLMKAPNVEAKLRELCGT